uniref:Putative secreted peptide n=1 Tax=Rhipicephalus pulchellus TaxID=72859 RepID=L7MC84_RHIPC
MAEKHLFMSVIIIVIIITGISGYRTCQGREKECGANRRPNCLEKNREPYFQCTPRSQRCDSAWLSYCHAFYALSCHDGSTYCDCYCMPSPWEKRMPRRSSSRRISRTSS